LDVAIVRHLEPVTMFLKLLAVTFVLAALNQSSDSQEAPFPAETRMSAPVPKFE